MKTINNFVTRLKEEFSTTDGSIESFNTVLNALIITGYMEYEEVQTHNELLFSDNPDYIDRSFEDLKVLENTFIILKGDKFSSFEEFCSFIGFISDNKSFAEIKTCLKGIKDSKKIIAAEGSNATSFSEISKSETRNMFENLNLNPDDSVQLLKSFPNAESLFSGESLKGFIGFLDATINKSLIILKQDISTSYPNFELPIFDYYKEANRLGAFCDTVDEFHKTFKSKTKEVK